MYSYVYVPSSPEHSSDGNPCDPVYELLAIAIAKSNLQFIDRYEHGWATVALELIDAAEQANSNDDDVIRLAMNKRMRKIIEQHPAD